MSDDGEAPRFASDVFLDAHVLLVSSVCGSFLRANVPLVLLVHLEGPEGESMERGEEMARKTSRTSLMSTRGGREWSGERRVGEVCQSLRPFVTPSFFCVERSTRIECQLRALLAYSRIRTVVDRPQDLYVVSECSQGRL